MIFAVAYELRRAVCPCGMELERPFGQRPTEDWFGVVCACGLKVEAQFWQSQAVRRAPSFELPTFWRTHPKPEWWVPTSRFLDMPVEVPAGEQGSIQDDGK